ncbi:hypothetical protein C7T94_05230 [Pedobacter yulinensis]|uniref:Lantibiotic dehydratase n=1 Tax=Pedobacter yulinensis TaxID=2126353 RepID=A0A2T3HNW6_9SPHI|nr:lantibiotic dehydratase [Pedobacter yulinensis]PST84132.1 hypothetical protein C7T94_05230 [Pedobacter yulinensis]
MKLYFYETALCRTPAFSMEAVLESSWEELKEKISGASADFFSQITGLGPADLAAMEPRIAFTTWKYFNRARFRATPFGRFAAVSLADVAAGPVQPLRIDPALQVTCLTDWKEKAAIDTFPLNAADSSLMLVTNGSMYRLGSEIRYICFREGQFELAATEAFAELDAVLHLCRRKRSLRSLAEALNAEFDLEGAETIGLIIELVTRQLILTDRCPNITGPDFFDRIGHRRQRLETFEVASRNICSGAIDRKKLDVLKEWARFVAAYIPDQRHPDLRAFRLAFLKKFEQRQVPLLLALDPEVGVGYGQLARPAGRPDLVARAENPNPRQATQIAATALQRFLLNAVLGKEPVQLHAFTGDRLAEAKLPNSMGLLLHFSAGSAVLNAAAGSTANSLLGRFTLAGAPYEKMARNMAGLEAQANPEVIFFDIAYQAEQQVDNVNRRRAIYNFEMPILSWSCQESTIDLNDVAVAVYGEEIVLTSLKDGRRLVPRLASAYNYTRSDLAVYRFLCDLQHEGLVADLNFDPAAYLPGLDHYPRLCYKKLIVSAAKWKIPAGKFAGGAPGSGLNALKDWLADRQITEPFKAGHADLALVFNPQADEDLRMFLHYLRQDKQVESYISEALLPDEGDVTDERGQSYAAQFVVSLCHGDRIYTDYPQQNREHTSVRKMLMPGGDWLFFSIFCHPSRSNALLLKEVQPVLNQFRNSIEKWFFIRYEDPRSHLRLRLQLRHPLRAAAILRALQTRLEPHLEVGTVADFTLNTYFRETERYGAARMSEVEACFHEDSVLVMDLIGRRDPEKELYPAAAGLLADVFLAALGDEGEQFKFVSALAGAFAAEMGFNKETFRKLNEQIKPFSNTDPGTTIALKTRLTALLQGCGSPGERKRLLADLIHMHVNRSFASEQRLHEAVLYQHLLKSLQAHRARAAQRPEAGSGQ